MNITESPVEMYISATDLFEINESYSKKLDNLPNPLISKMMPKINTTVECAFNA